MSKLTLGPDSGAGSLWRAWPSSGGIPAVSSIHATLPPTPDDFAITTTLPRFFSCLNPATLAMPAARLLSKSEQTLGLRTSTP